MTAPAFTHEDVADERLLRPVSFSTSRGLLAKLEMSGQRRHGRCDGLELSFLLAVSTNDTVAVGTAAGAVGSFSGTSSLNHLSAGRTG